MRNKPTKTKRIPITIAQKDYARAAAIAESEGMSFAGLVRSLIKKALRSKG